MARKYFGTDGIRGQANTPPMTAEIAMRFALAAGRHFRRLGTVQPLVVIGRDTRQSGGMLESALFAGFTSLGYHVKRAGVLPTPGVAMLTKDIGASLGVMISASHNLYQDNGLKLFGPEGTKLSDAEELLIEAAMDTAFEGKLATPADIGFITPMPDAHANYVNALFRTFKGTSLKGMKIVLDCANGAAVTTAPGLLRIFDVEPILIGMEPDGMNINKDVGSTATNALKSAVIENNADIGIALDGDADRLIVIDETGSEVDGDQLIGLIAVHLHANGDLKGGGVVSTIMSNMGLDRYLASLGLTLERTGVGDRYVAERMRTLGCNLGGEPSGHIILSDASTTGDGALAALKVLEALQASSKPMSELGKVFTPAPQKMVNIRYTGPNPLLTDAVKAAISQAETQMGASGRMVVRKSGTEPLVRVMAEALETDLMNEALNLVVDAVNQAVP
ncbi:UNVERIFIED_CONTAM: hypothetical protein GTU68_020409 [Idotea baltica]|nr:hypothetical protein [Idotea baltica]